ncbi:MAG: DUF2254 domain-containing protein [Pyrinomonadaceae bacterium]|nr:DUF2254 domain-containing protein [Pyrinomonadaceae bacterium]
MRYRSYARQFSAWGKPALYSGAAIAAGMTFPRIETHLFPGLISPMSVSSATAIYSSIASGMIALTGIVFSLTFVMVQFSATAYSPRLVLLIARDPVMSHALGIFTANFLYAIRRKRMSLTERITIDPEICHGKPTIRGLRYPVETILELLSSGMSVEDILADYEDLEREDILAALDFARRLSQIKRY